jgi:Integrase core domain
MEPTLSKTDKLLKNIYYNAKNVGSFGGKTRLFDEAKKYIPSLTADETEKWLQSQDTYTLHKPIRKHIKREKILVLFPEEKWEADLADMQEYAEFNDGYKYILVVIDCFSKYCYTIPLKDKTSKTVCDAFENIFMQSERVPWSLRTDQGKEFCNKQFGVLMNKWKISHTTTTNEIKACFAERVIRTFKERMWRMFSAFYTFRYIDKLQDINFSYNNTIHRTTKMKPIDVNQSNKDEVLVTMYGTSDISKLLAQKVKAYKYEVGDKVRSSIVKNVFEKGYTPNYTEEVFEIKEKTGRKLPAYQLKDLHGEDIKGAYLEPELGKVDIQKEKVFAIEKILKTRKRNGKKESFVKWFGYPESFNSWVSSLEDTHGGK